MVILKIYWHVLSALKLLFYKLIFGSKLKVGHITFRERFNLTINATGSVVISNGVFFNHDCSINCNGSSIYIGEGSIFGENVKIYDHNHCFRNIYIPIKEQGYTVAPVSIGKHCWIASNVIILKGVKIGDNVTIGAGCIIYKDIPSNTLVVNKQELVEKSLFHSC